MLSRWMANSHHQLILHGCFQFAAFAHEYPGQRRMGAPAQEQPEPFVPHMEANSKLPFQHRIQWQLDDGLPRLFSKITLFFYLTN